MIFCLLGFVSAQSGDTDKAKKIREAAIFTISFVACDSPFGNQLLWSIFKALRTFCAYQTLSFSSNAFRALIYIESLEVKAQSCLKLFFLSFPIALLSHICHENDLSSCSSRFSRRSLLHFQLPPALVLVGSSDSRISGTLTRMESLWASPFSSLMNW